MLKKSVVLYLVAVNWYYNDIDNDGNIDCKDKDDDDNADNCDNNSNNNDDRKVL